MRVTLLFLTILFCCAINAQEKEIQSLKKTDFPEGIYMTLDDVLKKTPSSTEEVFTKPAMRCDCDSVAEKVFFYKKQKNKKLLYPLAVVYNGELYFQTYQKYTNKKDKGYDPDAYSRFCKVSSYGRFIYFEESMRGRWSKALFGVLNPSTYLIKGKIKGIVLDVENREFNMLRNCEDLNEFLSQHQLQEIPCDAEKFTIDDLRKTVDAINAPYR